MPMTRCQIDDFPKPINKQTYLPSARSGNDIIPASSPIRILQVVRCVDVVNSVLNGNYKNPDVDKTYTHLPCSIPAMHRWKVR